MKSNIIDPIRALEDDYGEFKATVLSIPDELFLSPIHTWAPRDVVAHLIGWNKEMIGVIETILAGETPAYYADAPNDFSTYNARFVAQYSSTVREELLTELQSSMDQLKDFIRSLPEGELDADHGVVHHRGDPATIRHTILAFKSDYEFHAEEIRGWLASKT
jgi:hypothetical protein